MCPFHGWKFDAEGANTDIPYSDRINRKARIRTYPTVERNGLTLVWYHPDEAPPMWEVAEVAELSTGEFSGPKRTDHVVQAGIQELAENQVDSAHFRYVHNTATVPEIEKYELDGHVAVMRSVQKFPTPRGVVDGRIDNDSDGPGLGTVRFSGIVDTLLVTGSTPIDAETTQVRFNFYVRSLGDEETNSSVGAGVRRRGRSAVRGGHADLGAQGPPRPPGAGRQRRPVHEVPQVVLAVLRRAGERRPHRVPAAATGPRRWTRPPPRPPPAPSTAADDSGQAGPADQRRSDAAALASARASDSAFSRTLLDKRRGPLEGLLGLGVSAEPLEEIATHAVQEVVAVERALVEQLVDQRQRRRRDRRAC